MPIPALGSSRDIILRQYLAREKRTLAKSHELSYLTALASASDSIDKRKWSDTTFRTFKDYVALLWGKEPTEYSEEESKLLEFYDKVVKPSKVTISKDKDGKLTASGVPLKA